MRMGWGGGGQISVKQVTCSSRVDGWCKLPSRVCTFLIRQSCSRLAYPRSLESAVVAVWTFSTCSDICHQNGWRFGIESLAVSAWLTIHVCYGGSMYMKVASCFKGNLSL